MSHILENLTRRPVTVMGNSGKYYHLPPRHKLTVNALEVTGNAFVQKLAARSVVAVLEKPKAGDAAKKSADTEKTHGKSDAGAKGKR